MNWDAIGAIGEMLGALVVVITLVYLAVQIRYARNATIDQNRLARSSAVRELILATMENDERRNGQMRNWGLDKYYEELAKELGITSVEARETSGETSIFSGCIGANGVQQTIQMTYES
jgi:hypothetical protein